MPLISRTIAGLSAPKRRVKQIIELPGGSMYILNLFLVFKVVSLSTIVKSLLFFELWKNSNIPADIFLKTNIHLNFLITILSKG